MGSIFEGTPQTASSYVTSTSETPKWLQDAIYNQIQWAQNTANMPYQAYNLPTVAELSPLQQQAYQGVQAQQGAWKPGLTAAEQGTQAAAGQTAMAAAQPYMAAAAQAAPSTVGQYMSPYQQNVLDVIAKQGTRNLTENILPGVSDAFIKAGQFGSSQMGTMGQRAMRDTQEAILNQQAQAAQSGYTQALSAAQADAARQAQLASTAGSIGASDISRQLTAMQQLAAQTQQAQQLGYADTAALEAAGQAQQTQAQQQLSAAYQQWQNAQAYPKSQLDWLSTQVRGLAPIVPSTTSTSTTGTGQSYSASPLSQIASGLSAYTGASKLGLI